MATKRRAMGVRIYEVRIDLLEREYALLERWAKRDGVSVNSIIRSLIRNAPKPVPKPVAMQAAGRCPMCRGVLVEWFPRIIYCSRRYAKRSPCHFESGFSDSPEDFQRAVKRFRARKRPATRP